MESKLTDLLLAKGDIVAAATANVAWDDLAERLGESLIADSTPGAALITQSESLIDEGRFSQAAGVLRGCLAMRQKTLPDGHRLIADTLSRLGDAIARDGGFDEAEPLLLEGYAELEGNPRATVESKRQAIERIVDLYEAWEKPEQASEWRGRLEEATDSEQ
jgi:hypothetical protein